jgi:hypothetical protein
LHKELENLLSKLHTAPENTITFDKKEQALELKSACLL